MFHAAAFYSSLTQAAAYAQLAAVADGGLTRNAANLYIAPANVVVMAAHVQGVTVSAAQIQAPSLRNFAYPEIYPTVVGARTAIPDNAGYQVYRDRGPRILLNEAFGIYASEGNVGASPTNGCLFIADRFVPPPMGQIITVLCTSTIVLVDTQWTLGTLAFSQQLPVGNYAVVGMQCIMDNSNYARLVFPGASNWRPGCPVADAYGEKDWLNAFRVGNMGWWGEFPFNNPPQVEVFGAAAGSTVGTFLLDLVKVS